MIITIPNDCNITATSAFNFCSAIKTFLDYVHSGMSAIDEQPEIKFDTLILRRFCSHNGYVILGENPPKARKRTIVATFNEHLDITVRSPADVEVGLRRFVLDDKILVLTLVFEERPNLRLPASKLEIWKANRTYYVFAEGISETAPPRF